MVRRVAVVLLALAACGAPAETRVRAERVATPDFEHLELAVKITTTTIPPRVVGSPRAGRSRPAVRVSPPSRAPQVTQDGDFWRRLANCECASGHCSGPYIGYFQFSADTARKVGINGSESYEVQLAAAQRWLSMIGGRGGSRSGWPVCWWKAGGQ